MHVACVGQHTDIVQSLIDHGADVTITNEVVVDEIYTPALITY